MPYHILVAEDDPVFRSLICDILRKEKHHVLEAANGQEAIDRFFAEPEIDLVLLDVMMPIYDGYEVLKEIRQHSDVPVMILTALGDEQNEIGLFHTGANEFISKPFSYEVFLARLNNLLKKIRKEKTADLIMGELEVIQTSNRVKAGGVDIELSRKEYLLLVYLIKNKGLVLSREQILIQIWGFDFAGGERTIDTHIKTLRAKLLTCGTYLKTVRGMGYLMEVDK